MLPQVPIESITRERKTNNRSFSVFNKQNIEVTLILKSMRFRKKSKQKKRRWKSDDDSLSKTTLKTTIEVVSVHFLLKNKRVTYLHT